MPNLLVKYVCLLVTGAGPPSAHDLVAHYVTWQQGVKSVSMHVVAKLRMSGRENPEFDNQEIRSIFNRDGDLLDISASHLVLSDSGESKPESSKFHGIVDSNRYLVYQTTLNDPPDVGGFTSDTASMRSALLTTVEYGAALDGYFPGSDGRALSDLLANGSVLLRGDETVGGRRCSVVEGKTTFGTIKVWIDEDRGNCAIRVAYQKASADLFTKSTPLYDWRYGATHSVKRWSAVLDNVSLAEVGKTWLAVSGHFREEYELIDGRVISHDATYKRTDIVVHPTFAKRAFTLDLPNGTPMTDLDHPDAGVLYAMRDGDIAVKADDFSPVRSPELHPRPVIWYVIGILVAIGALAMLLRATHSKFSTS